MFIRRAAALVLLLVALTTRSGAQPWNSEIDIRTQGEVVWQSSVSADLNRDDPYKQFHLMLLPPEFTGQGFRWDVEYRAHRTKTTYPNWAAMMRMDAPCANGQVWGRQHSVAINAETETGTWTFHGEDHEEGRPHRIRFTFSQPPSFPYHVDATITCRRAPTTNIGGKLRETPTWVRVGTQAAPGWINGDLYVSQDHRWMLMSIEPGQTLRVLCRSGADPRKNASFVVGMWALNHKYLGGMTVIPSPTATSDTKLRTNTSGEREWIFVSLRSGSPVYSFELGFYTPQGASPPVGATVTPPSASELNPYEVVARDVKFFSGPGGSAYSMILPGAGEMIRVRMRALKTPYLSMGIGFVGTMKVYAADGTELKVQSWGCHGFGLEQGELYYELDASTDPNKQPVRIEFTTLYAQHELTVDATRYHRVR